MSLASNNLTTGVSPLSGPALAAEIDNTNAAFASAHKNATRPTYAVAGMVWIQEVSATVWNLYLYDGTDDILLVTFNPTTNVHDSARLATVQKYTAAQRAGVTAMAWSTNTATPTLDSSNDFSITLENAQANTIANASDIAAASVGQSGDFIITQNGTGASTLAWGSHYLDVRGDAFVDAIGTTLSGVTTYSYKVISATHIELIKVGEVS
jgi:hypothetical protein